MFQLGYARGGSALPQNFADPAGAVCLRKNPTGGDDDEAVQQASRHDLARALAPRYVHASRPEKGQLLDEFCAITGYTRKHALVLLSHPPVEQRVANRRGRPPSFGPAEVALLRVCWAALDGICSKRLAPFLPELLERLRYWHALHHVSAETIQRVAHMSPATIDRALAASRDGLLKRGLSTTRPGSLLKHQVAIKTFADWTETVPGFVEVDLVAHCGWTGAGPFLYTLTLVDVASGWVSCGGLRDKRAQTVLAALRTLQAGLPFKLLGLDSDSGSEFLNTTLIEYCAAQHITFTRGRAYRKNDGCFVEQKNWAVVRRLVGYQRLEAPALPALERVHDLARDYVNFLHPVRRLTEKVRRGARVTRRYDTAQTPYRRLVASGTLTKKAARQLAVRSKALDPLHLKLELESAQHTLAERAVRQPSVGSSIDARRGSCGRGGRVQDCGVPDRCRAPLERAHAQVHLPLTLFANRTRQQLSVGSARAYLAALRPFMSAVERNRRSVEAECGWELEPPAVRRLVADYLNDRYACLVRQHRVGFQLVAPTASTRSGVGLFLAALKFFYRMMREEGIYPHDNPLVDQTSVTLVHLDRTQSQRAPRMPDHSGVVVPRTRARFSDSYFKLVGDDWIPQIVDDPTLPARVLAGGRTAGWGLREECVARILFESGARVSEVVGLTLGDWSARGLRQEASAFSKGSHGRRIKFVRFSANTAKLLRRYFDGERRQHDAEHRTLNDYLAASERGLVDLSQVPVFLSSQRTALKASHFRDNFWTPACRAARIDADVHQARHWYVTMAIRQIHETARTEAEVKRRSRELIAYMKWRQGWQTMRSYDHYFDAGRHAEVQDELHRRFERSLQAELSAMKRGRRESRTSETGRPCDPLQAAADPRTAFLESLLQ